MSPIDTELLKQLSTKPAQSIKLLKVPQEHSPRLFPALITVNSCGHFIEHNLEFIMFFHIRRRSQIS